MSSRQHPVVAVDGPVAAGKSTAARALARVLGFNYLNTGAMYRAVAVAVRHNSDRPGDISDERLAQLLESITIKFEGERLLLAGRDISAEILTPEISDLASRLSARPLVRAKMRDLQRAAGEDGAVVMEGRDIGTAVFPDAEFKFFLTADVKVRAARRFTELSASGVGTTQAEVLAQLKARDRRDEARELAPLRRADDALVIDSSRLSIEQVVAAMAARIRNRAHPIKGLNRG